MAVLPSVTIAQSLPQPDGYDALATTAPAATRPYGFAILGVKPGMTIADALVLIEAHLGKELLPVGGTLQITSPDGKAFRTELRVGYETPSIDFFLRNQSQDPFDNIMIDVSTPAIGSVVTSIRREVRVPAGEGPDGAGLRAQLEGLYGAPSEIRVGESRWVWAEDLDYAPIPLPADASAYHLACDPGLPTDGRYSYQQNDTLDGPRKCGVTSTAVHRPGGATITMDFRLTDYNLIEADRAAANAQIDGKLSGDTQPADMKL
jgi:hypothetical protein